MPRHKKISASILLGRLNLFFALGFIFVAATNSAARCQSSEPNDAAKIIIGQVATGPGMTPLYVALDQGFFTKAGIDVTSVRLAGGTPSTMAAYVGGSVNMLACSAPELVEYAGKKILAGKAFAEVADHQFDVVVTKDVKNIHDIKGKIVGISSQNAADYIYIVALLEHYGISRNDVTFISVGTPVNRLAALTRGVVQVVVVGNTQREASLKSGTLLLKSGDSPIQFPNNIFIANDDLIKNHRPILVKFVAALHDTINWMSANPEKTVAICAKGTGATPEDCAGTLKIIADKSIASPYTWSPTLAINIDGVKSAIAMMASVEPEIKNVTIDEIVDTSIVGTKP